MSGEKQPEQKVDSFGELVRFETWQRLWKRTRGLGVGPAAGRMGRFALELLDGDSFQCFS